MHNSTPHNFRKLKKAILGKKFPYSGAHGSKGEAWATGKWHPDCLDQHPFIPIDALVYGTVHKYSRSGVSFATRDVLLEASNLTLKAFQRSLARLEKHHMIYRKIARTTRGTEVYLIPKHRMDYAVKNLIKIDAIQTADEVIEFFGKCSCDQKDSKKYLDKVFEKRKMELKKVFAPDAKPQKETPSPEETHRTRTPSVHQTHTPIVHRTPKPSCLSLQKHTTYVNKTTKRACAREEVGSNDPPNGAKAPEEVVFSEEEKIRKGLEKCFPEEQVKLGMGMYRKLPKEKLESIANPGGYIYTALKRGFAMDYERMPTREETANLEETNRKTAQRLEFDAYEKRHEKGWKLFQIQALRNGLEIATSGCNSEPILIPYSLSSSDFNSQLLQLAQKANISCPLFDSIKNQSPGHAPEETVIPSSIPKSTTSTQSPSNSSTRLPPGNPSWDPWRSKQNSECLFPPPGPPNDARMQKERHTFQSPISLISLNSSRIR